MDSAQPITFVIVAGERSGDMYGGRLASALKTRQPDLALFGCGGEAMRKGTVEIVAGLEQFAMVGITEVVSGLPRAYRAFNRIIQAARERRPRMAILIDSPSLNMRVAKRLKALGVPVLYFVSPQIWAWKKWRLRQLKPLVDCMVCIFEFEREIYHKAGIPAEYVGHPLVDTVAARLSRLEFFARAGLDADVPLIALLPGSRGIEVKYILPGMLQAAAKLASRRNVQFVLAVAPTLDARQIESIASEYPGLKSRLHVVTEATYEALAYSILAVVASGTATVEAAILERPMVVVYRVSPATAFFARWMVDVRFFSMVNILAGNQIVPELIQRDFTVTRLVTEVEKLLDQPEVQLEMVQELRGVKSQLGEAGAVERVAEIALRMSGKLYRIHTTAPAEK